MKILKLDNVVRQAVMLKVDRKRYMIYVTKENSCDVIKIVSLFDFNNKNSQVLLKFRNSVFLNIACDGKSLYVAKRNLERKLEKYRIHENGDKFLISKEKEIELPNKNMQIQCITSSENGKIAIFDMSDGSIYEILDDELKFVRCVRQSNQELFYIKEKLFCTCDTEFSDTTKSTLVKYKNAIGSTSIRSIYYNYETFETIFGIERALVFEKNSSFNGLVFLEGKEMTNINMYENKLVICCYDNKNGYIIILNPKDVKDGKENFIININKLKKKKEKLMYMIAKCSGGDETVFYNFSTELKMRGTNMYEDMENVYKENIVGREAFYKYREYKNS